MAMPRTYTNNTTFAGVPTARTGGSLGNESRVPMIEELRGGSHMPLDTDMHWSWNNPLNIFPAFVLLATVIALFGMFL